MAEYEVTVEYTETWVVEVKADDEDGAQLKAINVYRDGTLVDTDEDATDVTELEL